MFDSHGHAHATSEPIEKVQNIACVEDKFVQYASFTIR